jgi:hypothetical protein
MRMQFRSLFMWLVSIRVVQILDGIARSVVAWRVVRADVRKGVALNRKFPARQLIVRAKNDAMGQLEQDQSNCASR